MQLEIAIESRTIDDPSLEQVEAALRALPGDSDWFVILSRESMTYIQTAGDYDEGYVLECQKGSLQEHFICTDADLGLEAVLRAFLLYAQDDERWWSELGWERMDMGC